MNVLWGLWRRDGQSAASSRMAAVLRPYGPDRESTWVDGSVALGSALAVSVPEDKYDRQPLVKGGCRLVADARLDDRQGLAAALSLPGDAELSDADLILAAWLCWGSACVQHLVGDYAFAVWDADRRRLFCARDPLGGRSLYYVVRGPLFAFATLPKGVLALPDVPRTPSPEQLLRRLALLPDTGGASFFADIHALRPGECLQIGPQGETSQRTELAAREVRLPKDQDYVDAFNEQLDRAVTARLRSVAPVGTMLSGGLDSSAVTVTAAARLASRCAELTAFTSVPDPFWNSTAPKGRIGDEGEQAGLIAAALRNVRHVKVAPLAGDPLDLIAPSRLHSDSPGGALCMLPASRAMAVAHREAGIGTVLTGATGNMTISYDGLSLLPALLASGRWLQWGREASALAAKGGWRGAAAASVGPFLPHSLWRHVARHSDFTDPGCYTAINPDRLRDGSLAGLALATGWSMAHQPARNGPRGRIATLMRQDPGPAAQVGKAIAGVEFRDPTRDRRLVEFCLGVPEQQFLRRGETRWLLRRAMRGRIPDAVLDERRRGLVGADWALRVAPCRERWAAAIDRMGRSQLAQYCLDIPRLHRLVEHWPAADAWNDPRTVLDYRYVLCRAMAVGEFILWAEGGNA